MAWVMRERKWFDKVTPAVSADGAKHNKHERYCLDPGDPAPAGHEGRPYTVETGAAKNEKGKK